MENNSVHLVGTVKRDATAADTGNGGQVLDFALMVTNPTNGRFDIFDCRLTSYSAAMDQLEGFVTEGERLELVGRLEKQTRTEDQRIAGVWVQVRTTQIVVYVESIIGEVE